MMCPESLRYGLMIRFFRMRFNVILVFCIALFLIILMRGVGIVGILRLVVFFSFPRHLIVWWMALLWLLIRRMNLLLFMGVMLHSMLLLRAGMILMLLSLLGGLFVWIRKIGCVFFSLFCCSELCLLTRLIFKFVVLYISLVFECIVGRMYYCVWLFVALCVMCLDDFGWSVGFLHVLLLCWCLKYIQGHNCLSILKKSSYGFSLQ